MTTSTEKPDELQRMTLFNRAMKRVGANWPTNAEERLAAHHPEANTRLELTQDALNDTWLACQAGTADLKAFKAALDDWETERFKAAMLLAGRAK